MTIKLATSRINYVGNEKQLVLNTTVKSSTGMGKLFAPTWKLVMDSKKGLISWEQYTRGYIRLLYYRFQYEKHKEVVAKIFENEEIVLCCYCKDTHETTKHCHRYILIDVLTRLAKNMNVEVDYIGELK